MEPASKAIKFMNLKAAAKADEIILNAYAIYNQAYNYPQPQNCMFSFTPSHNDLTQIDQQEREAIVDLLHLCLFADAHISSKESSLLSKDVDKMGWDSNEAFYLYESRSIAEARRVRLDDDKRAEFLQAAAARLQSKDAKELAVKTCEELFKSDGFNPREETLLGEIREALK